MEEKASPPPSASKKRKSLSPDGKSASPSPYRLVRRRRGSTGSLPSAVGVSEMQGAAGMQCDFVFNEAKAQHRSPLRYNGSIAGSPFSISKRREVKD